jgi:hypothetical protein
MPDIARIRTLIATGKHNADIAAQLQQEARNDPGLKMDDSSRTFRALAATMHRAVLDERTVASKETLVLLNLLRRFWEEVAARGDVPNVESATLTRLAEVAPATTVGKAYEQLHEDMLQLSRPVKGLNSAERLVRKDVESRYLRQMGGHPVICCATAASAVADVLEVLYQVLGEQTHYAGLFTQEALQPALPLLQVYRPTWREILAEAKRENTLPAI